ncbi:hypothetical protein H9P43_009802 [Blastocladiella emersonii ATCC 22665]|nr:hypothetical protein H9P43_009802 [Blastocladiella emersonii ATCC 22665]
MHLLLLALATAALTLAVPAAAVSVTANTPPAGWAAGQTVDLTWSVNPSGTSAAPMDKLNVYVMRCDTPACLNAVTVQQVAQNVDASVGKISATLDAASPAAPDYFIKLESVASPQSVVYSGKIPLVNSGNAVSSSSAASAALSTTAAATTTSTASASSASSSSTSAPTSSASSATSASTASSTSSSSSSASTTDKSATSTTTTTATTSSTDSTTTTAASTSSTPTDMVTVTITSTRPAGSRATGVLDMGSGAGRTVASGSYVGVGIAAAAGFLLSVV